MVTKRIYEAVAQALWEEQQTALEDSSPGGIAKVAVLTSVAHRLCSIFREDNPRFDSQRFMQRAGLEG